jgi:hypothetical protein
VYVRDGFYWLPEPDLVDTGWPHPWQIIRFKLMQQRMLIADMEGYVVKPFTGRAVYFILNGTRREFIDSYQFMRYCFTWDDVWWLDDALMEFLPYSAEPVEEPENPCRRRRNRRRRLSLIANISSNSSSSSTSNTSSSSHHH